MTTTDRAELANMNRRRDSVKTVLEGLIAVGIAWMVAQQTQQGKDMAAIKANGEYVAKDIAKVPELMIRMSNVELTTNDLKAQQAATEERIADLETLRRVK